MGQDESASEKPNATINAVAEIVKAVPVYQDAVQPAAKQVGQALEVVTKAVNVALAPIKVMVWGYEKIENYLTRDGIEKLKDVPEEKITTPSHNCWPAVKLEVFRKEPVLRNCTLICWQLR